MKKEECIAAAGAGVVLGGIMITIDAVTEEIAKRIVRKRVKRLWKKSWGEYKYSYNQYVKTLIEDDLMDGLSQTLYFVPIRETRDIYGMNRRELLDAEAWFGRIARERPRWLDNRLDKLKEANLLREF